MAKLTNGFKLLAQRLQEQATSLSQSDIRARLADQLRDQNPSSSPYGYCYILDVFGDDESGDVVYQCDGETYKASYVMGSVAGKAATCSIDTENAQDVVPRTVYELEAEDDEHYTAMEAGLVASKLYTALPLYERFISKAERDKASADDFAGKGKSFPILKPEDVTAAARSIGRAGSDNKGPTGLKASIIAIAKRKGWEKYLPKAWQGDSTTASESARKRKGDLSLVEASAWLDDTLKLIEAEGGAQTMEIKLIAPGKGSSAFYPAEVLKRDGPKVFTKGTQMYINHATSAEEAARPEGDWHKLAGALQTDAYYSESHPKGAGLYAQALFTSEHAGAIREKAKFSGLSIRAGGLAEAGKKQDGLPVLKELVYAESVDVVTRAGAGGMVLVESAKHEERGDVEMTEAEIKALVESAVKAALTTVQKPVSLLEAKAVKGEATGLAHRLMSGLSLAEASKQRVVETVTAGTLPTKDGELDVATFTTMVTEAAKKEGEYVASLTRSGAVRGMGASQPVQMSEADTQLAEAQRATELKQAEGSFLGMGLPPEVAKLAAKGRSN